MKPHDKLRKLKPIPKHDVFFAPKGDGGLLGWCYKETPPQPFKITEAAYFLYAGTNCPVCAEMLQTKQGKWLKTVDRGHPL